MIEVMGVYLCDRILKKCKEVIIRKVSEWLFLEGEGGSDREGGCRRGFWGGW